MEKLPFHYILVVHNPKSTNARNTERRIGELRTLSPAIPVEVIETSPKGRVANKRLLAKQAGKLGPHTLLCIAAGDGTINILVEALLQDAAFSAQARKTPVLPLWCGNANDLAHMLNGKSYRTQLGTLLANARAVKVYPLECKLTGPDGTVVTYLAVSYASFGASAVATVALRKAIRKTTALQRVPAALFLQEAAIAGKALLRAPTFMVREGETETPVFERICFNGPRLAKISGVRQPLTEAGFHEATVRKRASEIVTSVYELAHPKHSRKYARVRTEYTILQDTCAQFDGEAFPVAAGTHVVITVAKTPLYALARL
ncbi:MAG TPA: diacylglycerol kinase family protein [Candidatus Saccharimonadales bacterium]|nr:diacylglycerol kinase family protein [Candidatus Saccharimonadales bacterium]